MVRAFIWLFLCASVGIACAQNQSVGNDDAASQAIQSNPHLRDNANPEVAYIGTQQCIECHTEEHASYLRTTHSASTTLTDPAKEAASATYRHPALGWKYEVDRKDGKLIHREIIPDADGGVLIMTQQPIDYTIGSGHHAKSYLFRVGEFYGQSPLTWYQEPNAWRMSPGFEHPGHPSFHRKIGTECMFCHVGIIDRKELNPYKFELIEHAIGCERCHGPGELHARKYRENPDASGEDRTIVNPATLPRELGESICQQCHLQGVSWVNRTGKDHWDFRPSMPITDVRVDYQLSLGASGMRIVGHVEQMHASPCYQKTETLTCVTCHDPHNPIPHQQRVDFYRQVCLDCHANESCGKPLDQRLQLAANNCYQCHMPKADTNVTHAAFHDHRIGIHPVTNEQTTANVELVPILDVTRLPQRERLRCRSLAQVTLMRTDPNNQLHWPLATQAYETLIQLRQTGPVDAVSDSALALLAFAQNEREMAKSLAQESITKDPTPHIPHIEARSLLAKLHFQDGERQAAVEGYRKVVKLHRDPLDAYYLGLCESNVGNLDAAIKALNASLEIDPTQIGPHRALEAIYRAMGQETLAEAHARQRQRIEEAIAKQSGK